jgi:hypothetical protein|tara:strand:+ start:2282 stop:2680 length:399 start_codon:yes stop_codon:yes gene_type:complete
MKTEFCSSCGNKVEYSFSPPNFCGKCGASLNGGKPARAASPVIEEVTDQDHVPQLSQLQYDIDYEGAGSKSLKLGDLATQQPAEESRGKRRKHNSSKKAQQPSKEEVLSRSVAECKSVGNTSLDVGGKKEKS